MKVSRVKIANVIAPKAAYTKQPKKLSRAIAAYLIENHRVNDLNSILRDIQQEWADHGIVEVNATSAHPLNAAVKADIKQEVKRLYPKADKIIISEYHDPEILGGLRLVLANQQLDLSIENNLNKFRQLTVK